MFSKKYLYFLVPTLLLLVITPFTPFLDISIARFFYNQGAAFVEHFPENRFLDAVFDFGPLPANLIGFLAACLFLLSFKTAIFCFPLPRSLDSSSSFDRIRIFNKYRPKRVLGRPRPKQIVEFGGHQTFRPYYIPNFGTNDVAKSFPSGHATMGFYFVTFFFLGRRMKKPCISDAGIFLALILGTLLGVTRMAQGAHFFSDILFSAYLMWLVAAFFDRILFIDEKT